MLYKTAKTVNSMSERIELKWSKTKLNKIYRTFYIFSQYESVKKLFLSLKSNKRNFPSHKNIIKNKAKRSESIEVCILYPNLDIRIEDKRKILNFRKLNKLICIKRTKPKPWVKQCKNYRKPRTKYEITRSRNLNWTLNWKPIMCINFWNWNRQI